MIEKKFDDVVALLEQHNEAVDKEGRVDPKKFINSLKAFGGTSEDRLRKLSYEDILSLFPRDNFGTKPVLLAKDIAAVFRDKVAENKQEESSGKPFVSAKKAEKMTLRELLENLDVDDLDSAVAKRLQNISEGKPFVVYKKGSRNINVEESLNLLKELKNYPPRKVITIGKDVFKVHSLSDVPGNYVDENPFYPGRPLRPDGTCDQLNRSWEGVELEIRQFIRIACEMGEIKANRDKMHDILDEALKDESFQWFRQRYPDVTVKFDERKELNTLPALKVQLGQKESPVSGNPFDGGQKVEIEKPLVSKKVKPLNLGNVPAEGYYSPSYQHLGWKYSADTRHWYDPNGFKFNKDNR